MPQAQRKITDPFADFEREDLESVREQLRVQLASGALNEAQVRSAKEAVAQITAHLLPDLGKPESIRGPLTAGEKIKIVGKEALIMLPPAAGATTGALKGAGLMLPTGQPLLVAAGGIVGGGLGAGGGEAIVQIAKRLFPSVFGQAPPVAEAASEVAQQAAFGMLAEAGGRALPEVAGLLFKGRKLDPKTAAEVLTLEREGVPYTAGDVRPGGAAQITENLMRGTLLGGNVMADFDVAQAAKLYAFRRRFVDSVGPLFDKEQAGQLIASGVGKRADQLFAPGGLFSRAYQRVSQLYPGRIDTAAIRAEIMPIRDEVKALVAEGRIPSASSPDAPSKFLAVLEDLANYGTAMRQSPQILGPNGQVVAGGAKRVEIPHTYEMVWQDKQTIDSTIRKMDDVLRTRAKATAVKIHDILDRAMERTAQSVDPKAAAQVRAINNGYRKAKELFETESAVVGIRNEAIDPERIVDRFFRPGAITPAKDLIRALPPREKDTIMPVVRRRILENLFQPIEHHFGEVPVLSGKRLETSLGKARESMKVYFSKDQMAALDEFVAASKRAQMSGTMQNPASGRQLLAYSQLGSALQFTGAGIGFLVGQDIGSGFVGMMGGKMVEVLGPRPLAWALTRPGFARTLAKGFRMSRKQAEATGWVPRAMNIFQLAKKAVGEQEEERSRQ